MYGFITGAYEVMEITATALIAFALIFVVFSAGCTQSSDSSSAANGTPVTTLRIGYQPSTTRWRRSPP